MKQKWIIAALAFICLLSTAPAFSAQETRDAGPDRNGSKGSASVDSPKYVPDEVLVRFKPGALPADMAIAHAAIASSVAKEFSIVDKLHLVKLGRGVDVEQALHHYRQHPDVLYAEPNWIVHAVETIPNDTSFTDLWGLKNTGQLGGLSGADIEATNAWDLTTGSSSVVVTVIDTGVDYTHPDLAANIWTNPGENCGSSDPTIVCAQRTNGFDDDANGYIDDLHGYDFVNNDGDPMDDHNHGTHVSGTIGAFGGNALGVVGVNWNVKIMACKFLDASGSGSTAGAISCMDYVKTMKNKGVNIIATSNSWGGGGFSQALLDAIVTHHQLGILFIAAAGNSNSNNDTGGFYPASYFAPNLIAVAATDRYDNKASFSSYGAHTVLLGAPGVDILSTTIKNTYSTFSGTSMATPHVTGVAALVKARFPNANWIEIKNRILAGSENIASMASTTITGKRLNANGALTCSNSVVRARLRPTLNTIVATVTTPIDLDVLHINCAVPAGNVPVTVNPGGQVLTLQDLDLDGIYSLQWTPPAAGTYTLTFPNSDVVTVYVLQPYNYTVTSDTYRNIAGTSLNFGDDSTAAINLGSPIDFPIRFGGGSFSTVYVSSNGNVNFTTAFPDYANTQFTDLPASNIGTLVAPFWDDLYAGAAAGENVFWQVTGTVPNRELVIEWRDVRHYSCFTDSTARVRFQVVFFENSSSSDILFNYADTVFGGACAAYDGGGSATIGVQTGSNQATTYSFNSQSLTDGMSMKWTTTGSPPLPSPVLSVTPVTQDFGNVPVGSWADRAFTVTNVGTGTLTGNASISSTGYSIVSGASFSLGAGASQNVTVHFAPPSSGTFDGTVGFASITSTSRSVTGVGVTPTITVTSLSGGVSPGVFPNNAQMKISWNSSGITGNVRIDLSRNNGSTWTTIFSSTPDYGANGTSVYWKVKRPQTTLGKIRVCSINFPSVCGISSGTFTIQ